MSNADGLISSTRVELAMEVLQAFGRMEFIAQGSSMLPTLWPGDVLQIRKAFLSREPLVGHVIVYHRDQRIWAHRVVRSTSGHIVTRGDAHSFDDPPILKDHILGEVVAVRRRLHTLPLVSRWWHPVTALCIRRSDLGKRVLLRLYKDVAWGVP